MKNIIEIFKKLINNFEITNIFKNISWLIIEKIIRLMASFFIGIWIARYLGPSNFGILNYAIAFVSLFQTVSTLGLSGIIVKRVVDCPNKEFQVLGTAFGLRFIGSVISIILIFSVISITRAGENLIQWLIMIIAISIIGQSFEIIDFWFQAKIKSKNVVIVKNIVLIIISLIQIVLILVNASLIFFALVFTLEAILGAIGLVIIYRMNMQFINKWQFNLLEANKLLSLSWPLIISGLGAVIYLRIDQIMIGDMRGSEELGIYSVAVRISEVWYFIPSAIAISVFPALIRLKKIDFSRYQRRLQQLYDIMVLLSLSLAIFFTFSSNFIINLLFGKEYHEAGLILSIHIWAGLFIFMGEIFSKWLINENILFFSLIRTSAGAVINVVLNYPLIAHYGGIGAAIATVVSYATASLFICFIYKKTRVPGYMMLKALLIPIRLFLFKYKRKY